MLLSLMLACALKSTIQPLPTAPVSASEEETSSNPEQPASNDYSNQGVVQMSSGTESNNAEQKRPLLQPRNSFEPDLSSFTEDELAPEQIAAVLQEVMHKFWTAESREVVDRVCNEPVKTEDVRLEKFVKGTCAKLINEDASLYSGALLESIQGAWSYDPEHLTLVTFWELWCPHCKRALPHLESLREQFEGADFDVVGITKLNRGVDVETVQAYATEKKIDFPLLKGEESFSSKYGVRGIPDTMLLKNDKIIWRGHPAAVTAEVIQHALRW